MAEILLAVSMHVVVVRSGEVSWIGQSKMFSAWIEKLELTRKIMATNNCLHTRSSVARLYLPRKGGGRELIGIDECVKKESKSLHGYLTNSTYGVDAANGFVGEGAC